MNTRARVRVLPMIMAASLGLANLEKMLAHESHARANMQPTGLEEINLTVDESGVTGMPESLAAGRDLVNVTGPEPGEMGPSGAIFAQLPEDVSAQQAYDDVLANPEDIPSWYLDTHFGGGATLSQGTETWAVIDFTPGTWLVTTPFGATLGVEFEVTGDMPAELPDPEANVTITLLEFGIKIGEGELVAGDNVVTVDNSGAQLHFVDVSQLPEGTTKDQVDALMDSFMTGTPPAEGDLQEDAFIPVAYLADVSPGVQETLPLALEPGTYFLACWVPDLASELPHAMMGMYDVVVVE